MSDWVSSAELAQILGVSSTTVSRLRYSRYFPDEATMLANGRRLYHLPSIKAWRSRKRNKTAQHRDALLDGAARIAEDHPE